MGKGVKNEIVNYRPISLPSVICKMFKLSCSAYLTFYDDISILTFIMLYIFLVQMRIIN